MPRRAIVATAWLTSRDTSEELRAEFERTIESDGRIYESLLSYAAEHPTWDGVENAVALLAAGTGQRIALTEQDGSFIVDSAAGEDPVPALPDVPAAAVDPFAPALNLGSQPLTPLPTDPFDATRSEVPEPPDNLRLDTVGIAAECLSRTASTTATAVERWPIATIDFDRAPRLAFDECGILETIFGGRSFLSGTGAQIRDGVTTCLASSTDVIEGETFRACREQAEHAVLDPLVADPALLYLGTATTDRFATVWETDRTRTAATVLAVLAVVTLVTVFAGRRLVRPIRKLTRVAHRMEAGERSARVRVTGRDEIAKLGHAFNAMAEAVDANERQRRAMVSDVAHELRSPLANLRGYLEAAEDGVVPVDRALVHSLLEEASALSRLVNDLQDMALADSGRLHLHPELVDASNIARATATAHQPAAASAEIALAVEADGVVPFFADAGRMRQALGNLVGNALRYTPAGGQVVVSVAEVDDHVEFSVEDTGAGIAPEHLPHVFDRFYRADSSRSRQTGGSGLGLAITKYLVEAHGGTISVASQPGRGSTFRMRMPSAGPGDPGTAGRPATTRRRETTGDPPTNDAVKTAVGTTHRPTDAQP